MLKNNYSVQDLSLQAIKQQSISTIMRHTANEIISLKHRPTADSQKQTAPTL